MKTMPLTPEQQEWAERMGAKKLIMPSRQNLRKGTRQTCCATCRHMRRHGYSDRYNYCAKETSKRTPCGLAKTKRSAVCDLWDAKGSEQ